MSGQEWPLSLQLPILFNTASKSRRVFLHDIVAELVTCKRHVATYGAEPRSGLRAVVRACL
jgi:hypothetical protein